MKGLDAFVLSEMKLIKLFGKLKVSFVGKVRGIWGGGLNFSDQRRQLFS